MHALKSLLKQLRVIPETLGVCFGLVFIPLLPRRAVTGAAALLGAMGFRLSRKLRRIAMANIDIAFGSTIDQREKEGIAKEAFKSFALVVLDLFWFGTRAGKRINRYVQFDKSFDHYLNNSPVVAVTAHLGNWELMGQAAALHGHGSVSVAMEIDSRLADRVLNRFRRGTGQRIVERRGAVRELLSTLKGGGKVALLLDQNTLPDEGGEYVDFFGLPAPMSKAAVVLACRTGAACVVTYCVQDGKGGYRACALPPLRWRAEENESKAMQELANGLASVIRMHSGQWLWMYKRWKYIPDSHDGRGFPFYARKATAGDGHR